jgi:hypothetical protein
MSNDMRDQEQIQSAAETFVRDVLMNVFKQDADAETIRKVASEVARAVPSETWERSSR